MPNDSSAWLFDIRRADVLAFLGGLQLLPRNHAHLVRLERAVQLALSRTSNANAVQLTNPAEIFKNLKATPEEDPTENLFTENFVFFGGNYRVFPGIDDGPTFILRHLLEGLYWKTGKEVPAQYKTLVRRSVCALLCLSERAAEILNYPAWVKSESSPADPLAAPEHENHLKQATTIPKQQLAEFLREHNLALSDLEPFILDGRKNYPTTGSLEDHPLYRKPVVDCGEDVVIALPCSFLSAARHYVLISAQSAGLIGPVGSSYERSIADEVEDSMRMMSFAPASLELPPARATQIGVEYLAQFDSDKLCFVQLVVDKAADYGIIAQTKPVFSDDTETLDKRLHEVATHVLKEGYSACLVMKVYAGVGRTMTIAASRPPSSCRILMPDAESLKIVSRLADIDNLSLWKYAEALDAAPEMPRILSFLDPFTFYWGHRQSFYFSDDVAPDFVAMSTDMGTSTRSEGRRRWGGLAVRSDKSTGVRNVVRRFDEEIPIWMPDRDCGRIELYVGEYSQPLWVRGDDGNRSVLIEVVEAVAYWLWQLSPRLSAILDPLGDEPITIEISAALEYGSGSYVQPADISDGYRATFTIDGSRRAVTMDLPADLRPWLARDDNEGERRLLDGLLRALADLGSLGGIDLGLSDGPRAELINAFAPLGQKRKFFLVDTSKEPTLDARGLRPYRAVSSHNVEELLDGLGERVREDLGASVIAGVGMIPAGKRRDVFQSILRIYLTTMRERVAKLAPESLMLRLMDQNEALTRDVYFEEFVGPTSAACFRDAKQQSQLMAEAVSKMNRAAIATRFLIEFVAAEPPKGSSGAISDNDLDELIAAAYGFVNWGMLGDEIRTRIVDPEVSMLASGRIGTDRHDTSWMEAFFQAKSLESLEREERYRSRLKNTAISPPSLAEENALFRAEFGISLEDLVLIETILRGWASEVGGGPASQPKSTFEAKVAKEGSLTAEVVKQFVAEFSLGARRPWDSLPKGFSRDDIEPWRFNRRLSFVRRPLVVTPSPDGERIVWGPRHLHRSVLSLLRLVFTGRYKLEHARSSEMKRFIGSVVDERGSDFESTLSEFLKGTPNWKIEMNVKIAPNGRLSSNEDLGDVDVFVFDTAEHIAFALECKDILFGRSPVEMSQEMDRLFRQAPRATEPTRAAMHLKRTSWLVSNWASVRQVFDLSGGNWTLVPAMILEEEIPSIYALKPPLPVATFTSLRRDRDKELKRLVAEGARAVS